MIVRLSTAPITIKIQKDISTITNILETCTADLGSDFNAYRNHVFRVINYCHVLANVDECPQQVLIAAAYHDLGIWTGHTFDYLDPSVQLAMTYLDAKNLCHFAPEVETIIRQHHKVREFTGQFAPTVEVFRKADLIDVSLGRIRFGVPKTFINLMKSTFPNAGFHRQLIVFTVRQFVRTPWRPLPMVRW
jgi:hypothetical protein